MFTEFLNRWQSFIISTRPVQIANGKLFIFYLRTAYFDKKSLKEGRFNAEIIPDFTFIVFMDVNCQPTVLRINLTFLSNKFISINFVFIKLRFGFRIYSCLLDRYGREAYVLRLQMINKYSYFAYFRILRELRFKDIRVNLSLFCFI